MSALNAASPDTPFALDNHAAYSAWRERKLDGYPQQAEELIVAIDDPRNISPSEKDKILALCAKTNMAIYASNIGSDPDKRIAATLGAQFGLRHLDRNTGADDDGITALEVVGQLWKNRYIPYTNRAIHWHTDGYYNGLDQQVQSLLLHCVRPAHEGGENALLDHEIAYLRLRDRNPDYVRALMAPDVMTVPANIVDNEELRPARTGPVFSLRANGRLHMRYTARAHNIIWKDDPPTRAAVRALRELLASDEAFIYRLTLQSGWGLISDNVLHDRSGFQDEGDARRLLYRLRYYESVNLR